MNGYFYTLLTTSVCGVLCTMLARGGFEKYIKYISALICAVIIITPLTSIDISSFSDVIDEAADGLPSQPTDLYALSEKMTEERTEEYISEIVFNKFGIKPIYSDIKIDWEPETAVVQKITVALPPDAIGIAEEASGYLYEVLGGEVEIIEG